MGRSETTWTWSGVIVIELLIFPSLVLITINLHISGKAAQ